MFLTFKIIIATILLITNWKLYSINEKEIKTKTIVISILGALPVSILIYITFNYLLQIVLPNTIHESELNHLTGLFTIISFIVFFVFLIGMAFNRISSSYLTLFSKKDNNRRLVMNNMKNKLLKGGNYIRKFAVSFIIIVVLFKAIPNSFPANIKSQSKQDELDLILSSQESNTEKKILIVTLINKNHSNSFNDIEQEILLIDSITNNIYMNGLESYYSILSKDDQLIFKKSLEAIDASNTLTIINESDSLFSDHNVDYENLDESLINLLDYNDSLLVQYIIDNRTKIK
jgi:hypothetical protein